MVKLNKKKSFVKNTSYIFLANIITTLMGVVTTLFIPKICGEDTVSYGYYQLYMMYISYVGFFHLGWCDGIFLKVGGLEYKDLDKNVYGAQFWLLFGFEVSVSLMIVLISDIVNSDEIIKHIILLVAISLVFIILSTMLSQILHATMRAKEYAIICGLSRILFVVVVIGMYVLHIKDYRIFLAGDVVSRIMTLIMYVFCCKDLVFSAHKKWRMGISEAVENTKAGIHLLISNLSNGFIIDVSRIFIINKWGVSVFGKLSLTLKIVNFIMLFINSISLVLYPALRNVDEDKLESDYSKIDTALMVPLLSVLAFYYPFQYLFCLWIPEYTESLTYMSLLLPVCVYTCKMNMLSFTYMKVKRLENLMMKIMIFSVFFALVTSSVSVFVFGKMELCVLMIVMNRIVASTASEIAVKKYVNIDLFKNMVLELLVSIFFIIANWYIGGLTGMGIYIVVLILYYLLKKNDIIQCMDLLVIKR